jgi:hypothetical protein
MRLVPGCALMLGLFAVFMPMDKPFAEEGIGQTNSDAAGTKTAMARAAPSVTPAPRKKAAEPPDTALTTALAGWIAAEFGLPRMRKPPDFVIVPAKRLVALRFGEVASDRWAGGANAAVRAGDIVSIYSDESRAIYLPEGWTGGAPADVSVVVHELVHHLQNEAGQKFACPEAREQAAFAAQEHWLAQLGTDLLTEFGIDPLTLLVRTNCLGY